MERETGAESVKLSVLSLLKVLVSVQVSHGALKEPLLGDEFLGKVLGFFTFETLKTKA